MNIENLNIKDFLNNITSGFLILSETQKIIFINTLAKKILNIKFNVSDIHISKLFEDNEALQIIDESIKSKLSSARNILKYTVNNKIKYLGFTTYPLIDNTNTLSLSIIFRDITNEITLNKKLEYSETKYKLLIQNLISPIFLLNYESFDIIETNKIASDITGFSFDDLIKKKFSDIINDKYVLNIADFIKNIKSGKIYDMNIEVEFKSKHKEFKIYNMSANILTIFKNKFIQILCFDITDNYLLSNNLKKSYDHLKITQDNLIKAERLAATGELAAGVSHEIKNRFQVISNVISYLKRKINMTDEAFKINIGYAENEISRGVELINDLMNFSKPNPHKKINLSLNDLITSSINLLKKQIEKKDIVLKIFVDKKFHIFADRNMIQQVLINILKNAIESVQMQGHITINAKIVQIQNIQLNFIPSTFFYDEYIKISFIDNGQGIEKENISKIFSPFFSMKDPNDGTGLGLSVSNSIIEKHKGFIDVTSKLGQGSEFIIYLPAELNEKI